MQWTIWTCFIHYFAFFFCFFLRRFSIHAAAGSIIFPYSSSRKPSPGREKVGGVSRSDEGDSPARNITGINAAPPFPRTADTYGRALFCALK